MEKIDYGNEQREREAQLRKTLARLITPEARASAGGEGFWAGAVHELFRKFALESTGCSMSVFSQAETSEEVLVSAKIPADLHPLYLEVKVLSKEGVQLSAADLLRNEQRAMSVENLAKGIGSNVAAMLPLEKTG